jgi:uncharacterized membrane protein
MGMDALMRVLLPVAGGLLTLVAVIYAAEHSHSGAWVVAVAAMAPVVDFAWSRHMGRTVSNALVGAARTLGRGVVAGIVFYVIWFSVYCGLVTECYR